jgi:hypothetical protein
MSAAMEQKGGGGKMHAIQDVINRLMEIREKLPVKEDPIKDMKREEKECRETIQRFMEEENIGTFERVRNSHNITLYSSWSQQSLNREFIQKTLEKYVNEKGNRLVTADVVDYLFQQKKDSRRKVTKLTIRACGDPKQEKKKKPTRRKVEMDTSADMGEIDLGEQHQNTTLGKRTASQRGLMEL